MVSKIVHDPRNARWRAWGYRSRLGEIVCGESSAQKKSEETQGKVAEMQLGVAQDAGKRQDEQYAQYQKDVAPLRERDTALASGDRREALAAAMPVVSKLSAADAGAKQRILDTMPPGPARDLVLARQETDKATTIGTTQADLVRKAPEELAAMGSGEASLSLQELGAMLSGATGASDTSSKIYQEENATQQNKLGMITGLAQAAGTAVGGTKLR